MMLRRLKHSVTRLARDRGGNVVVIMGLSFIPLVLMVGASIDYSRTITRRTGLQQATDATVLAVSHYLTQNLSSATIATNAQSYFAAAVGDNRAWIVSGPTVSPDNTQVCMTTRTTVPTTIMRAASSVGLAPSNQTTVVATSCSKINNTTYEIAMVLDNSGSMAESTSGTTKIASLQTAATQMVNIMNPNGQTPRASFSLVPFSLAVNVGAQNRGASWLDNAGQSSIAFQNFAIPSGLPTGAFRPASRFALFDALGLGWGGCVEERSGSYLASDTPATASNPDTLYEPYFYPDEYSTPNYNASLISRSGYSLANVYLKDQSATGQSCSASPLYAIADGQTVVGSLLRNVPILNLIGNSDLPRGDSQTMVCKYKSPGNGNSNSNVKQISWSSANSGFTTGPNLLCDSQSVTTLTNDNTSLIAKINAMYAKGSTNLFSGVMWGWRSISPNGPFGGQPAASIGPQNPKPYSTTTANTNNVKVMVLMTDGFNSWNAQDSRYDNNNSTYSPFGYFENSRLGTTNSSNWRATMDAATLTACNNAKAAGVQIYTVGFSIPSDPIDSSGLSLLQSCASKTSMAYIAQDGSGLISAFQNIAADMSGLRLVN